MPNKRHSPEQILGKLRQVEVALAKGETVGRAVNQIGVTEQTYYRWRNEYGGLSIDQAKRLKQLEQKKSPDLRKRSCHTDYLLRFTQIEVTQRWRKSIRGWVTDPATNLDLVTICSLKTAFFGQFCGSKVL